MSNYENFLLIACLFFMVLYAVTSIFDLIQANENKLKACFIEEPMSKECQYIFYKNKLKHCNKQ